MTDLTPLPTDWARVLTVVAHRDDMEYIEVGSASLRCHELCRSALDGHEDPDRFLHTAATAVGEQFGCDDAVAFEIVAFEIVAFEIVAFEIVAFETVGGD